jgi:hypothetical protein
MKTFTYSLIAATLLSIASCNADHKKQDHQSSWQKTEDAAWKREFKDIVACRCVLEGIGDKSINDRIEMEDKTLYNMIDIVLRDSIKKLLTPVISKIKQDSVASLTTVGEGAQGKRIFSPCLQFYQSKTLDSAATAALNHWKHTNVDSIMAVKAPAW